MVITVITRLIVIDIAPLKNLVMIRINQIFLACYSKINVKIVTGGGKEEIRTIYLKVIFTIRFNQFLLVIIHNIFIVYTSYVKQFYFALTFAIKLYCDIQNLNG